MKIMSIPIYTVDAFTAEPFRGNPAGVCLLEQPREESWMQAVAGEMKHSETAFVTGANGKYSIRWFTPAVEVALCGHATLASAHALFEAGREPLETIIQFQTLRSGVLTARCTGDWIELDFPAMPPREAEAPPELAEAFGVKPLYVGRSRDDYLLHVDSEPTVRNLKPDFARLYSLPVRGVIVTAAALTRPFDFVSRFFAPGAGIDEDPVTGSAHCCLGPYWQAHLGKNEFYAYQASARGGILKVRVAGERVFLRGQAVTVVRGELES
jgi:PhzF family phenazine biosynthesis protein